MSKTSSPVFTASCEAIARPTLWPGATNKSSYTYTRADISALNELAENLNELLNISAAARKRLTQEALPVIDGAAQENSLTASFQTAVNHARAAALPARLLSAIEKWRGETHSPEERLYVVSQLPAPDADLLARIGLLDPFDVFEAAAFDGDLARLRALYKDLGLADIQGWQDRLDGALSGAAVSAGILDGYTSSTRSDEVAEQLLDWGANPNAYNGEIWRDVLESCEGRMIQAFVDHGADIVPLLASLRQIALEKDFFGKRYFGKLDEQTLLEVTFLPPLSSRATFEYDSYLRTIYAFDRARVTEIVQTDSGDAKPSSIITRDLSDLPAATIKDRHARLYALGGAPVALDGIAMNDSRRTAMFKPRTP